MHLSEIGVANHRCQFYEPPERHPSGWSVVFLHDVDAAGLTGRSAYLAEFVRHGLPCIVPLSGRSWWTERIWPGFDASISTERYVIERLLPFVAQRWQSQPPSIALVGIGMGGQGALRLAFKYPNKFPVVVAVAPAIDYQLAYYDEDELALREIYPEPERARQDTATLHVHPLNWPRNIWFAADPADDRWYSSAERLKMKLSALGIPHEADLETSAGGQAGKYAELMAAKAMAFAVERLDREHRRV